MEFLIKVHKNGFNSVICIKATSLEHAQKIAKILYPANEVRVEEAPLERKIVKIEEGNG
jgi:hypothetical protein